MVDRAVALFVETVDGEDGWPCRRWPDGWRARARELLDEYARARQAHGLCGKPERARENFTRLRGYLEVCVEDPARLSGRDVGMIRKILATVRAARGLPGEARHLALRAAQARQAAQPTRRDLAGVLVQRLQALPADGGLASIEAVAAPTAEGADIPHYLWHKLRRCLDDTVEHLVRSEVITSPEVVARVMPQLTGQIAASGVEDPALKLLYAALYAAFRARRSLLLLNLEHQVRLDELPWAAAVRPFLAAGADEQALARVELEKLATLALGSFPWVIVPNKLLQELDALARAAGLKLPFVEEVAADIFMGTFTVKYLDAAKVAARLLEGTLYERYFGIDYAAVRAIEEAAPAKGQAPEAPRFAALCRERIPPAGPGRASWVAGNGQVIEQEQILTTHNLALLFVDLSLAGKLPLAKLARSCFGWICGRHQRGVTHWRARLQMLKNTAYAWRQLVFFLALVERNEVDAFLSWAGERLGRQTPAFRERFAPALRGLALAAAGGRFDPDGTAEGGAARRFLGWAVGGHWLQG
jgi:hypothetical protein